MPAKAQKLRVAVTGGSGKIGRETLRALQAAGHQTANFDLRPAPELGRTTIVDCTDFGQVMSALTGVDLVGGGFDAMVHLAGIPGPGYATDAEVFQGHVLSTYNVFSACQRLGINRVVWASSETLMGQPYGAPPPFLPVDESLSRPEWSYSLAKQLGETMADTFVRWSPRMSITSLRFSNVFAAEDYANLPSIQQRPESRRLNLWGYVDARDCGAACQLAVEAALPGHEALIIAADDTLLDVDSSELAARFFPDTPVRGRLEGRQALLSIEKAKRMLGYAPRHTWRDETRGRS